MIRPVRVRLRHGRTLSKGIAQWLRIGRRWELPPALLINRTTRARDAVLAGAILFAILAGIYAVVIAPYVAARAEQRAEITRLTRQIANDRNLLGRRESVARDLSGLQDAWKRAPFVLSADSHSLATVALSRRIKAAAAQIRERERGCQGISINTDSGDGEAEHAEGAIRPVHVGVRMTCGMHGLHAVLRSLERDRPVVLLDRITIRRHNRIQLRGKALPARLEVRFTVTGFIVESVGTGVRTPQLQESSP